MSNLVGFYRDEATAKQVREELLAAGINAAAVTIRRLSQEATSSEEPGFWHDIKSLFGYPGDSSRHIYEDAARHGFVPVIVKLPDDSPQRPAASEIMRRHAPIDVAATSSQWQRGATATETTDPSTGASER